MSMQIMMRMVMMVVIVLNKVVGIAQFCTLKNCHLVVQCSLSHDNTSSFRLKPFFLWVNVDVWPAIRN